MGQKVHPYGFRLGYNVTWKSRWFARKNYGRLLHEDLRIKKGLKQRFYHAGISNIEIELEKESLGSIDFDSNSSNNLFVLEHEKVNLENQEELLRKKTLINLR